MSPLATKLHQRQSRSMRKSLAVLLALVALPAWPGELLIGKIVVVDGGSQSNQCTATPFDTGANRKLTAQCNQDVAIGVGVSGCDAGNCLTILAGEKFPTSTGAAKSLTCPSTSLSDGGFTLVTAFDGWISIQPVSAVTATCKVFGRSGTE